ncbi:DUF6233 domain-containing protein [Streptomyces broussonetiae]|nr:DUF6233 domain-containing protein [Streptomyces broussonetiae]
MSRLEALRFTRRVVEEHTTRQLAAIDRWIADEERRERERRQAEAARPAPPDWLLDYGRTQDALPVAVRTGGCTMTGKRSKGVDSDTARRTLASGVRACTFCRPDTELGILG